MLQDYRNVVLNKLSYCQANDSHRYKLCAVMLDLAKIDTFFTFIRKHPLFKNLDCLTGLAAYVTFEDSITILHKVIMIFEQML